MFFLSATQESFSSNPTQEVGMLRFYSYHDLSGDCIVTRLLGIFERVTLLVASHPELEGQFADLPRLQFKRTDTLSRILLSATAFAASAQPEENQNFQRFMSEEFPHIQRQADALLENWSLRLTNAIATVKFENFEKVVTNKLYIQTHNIWARTFHQLPNKEQFDTIMQTYKPGTFTHAQEDKARLIQLYEKISAKKTQLTPQETMSFDRLNHLKKTMHMNFDEQRHAVMNIIQALEVLSRE